MRSKKSRAERRETPAVVVSGTRSGLGNPGRTRAR